MKTNGRPAKGSKPYVPGGAPLAPKARSQQGGRGRQSSKPLYHYDNPNISEIDWLDDIPASIRVPLAAKESRVPKVRLHGVALESVSDTLPWAGTEPEAEFKPSAPSDADASLSRIGDQPEELPAEKEQPGYDVSEIRYSSALSVRAPGTARLLPRQALAADDGPASPDDEAGQSPKGAGVQHGTIPFAFRDRARIDLIIPLQTPFMDSEYSFVCSLDVPHCHAVVRAKLTAEAVVTLIRTQEEGNARGRIDWIAAGRLQEGI
ncbi:WIAG-tail domain [Paenibacillus humicus]|uniref:WIAG-tail domain n=1 Tax=Paenibacillus humicus TaxID=412861 RepID=UPI003F16686D